jgi:hypothetical protein
MGISNTARSRRAVLAGIASAAALPIAATIPTAVLAAAPAVDPIYAAIERHRHLAKIYDAAWKVRGDCRDFGTLTEDEKERIRKLTDACDEAGLPLEAAALDLIDTAPTTHGGIISALFYMRIQHRKKGEHMIQGWLEDEDCEDGERYIDWCDAWLETLTQAVLQLDDAAVQS